MEAVKIFIIAAAAAVLIMLILPFLVSGSVDAVPVSFYFEKNITAGDEQRERMVLSVMTLNMGHGRGSGKHQFTQGRNRIKTNADRIAETVSRERIDITALQEADGPGLWSGGHSLTEYLAEKSGCRQGVWIGNVDTPALRYGTALIGDLHCVGSESYTFRAKPFILPKGFTTGLYDFPGENDLRVMIVSLHLAPLNPLIRRSQADYIAGVLSDTSCPLIVMGDFNCGWREGSALNRLADRLNLKAWEPLSGELGSFGNGRRRLDWILVSDDFDFISYENIGERLSDHSAVKAVVRYTKKTG